MKGIAINRIMLQSRESMASSRTRSQNRIFLKEFIVLAVRDKSSGDELHNGMEHLLPLGYTTFHIG